MKIYNEIYKKQLRNKRIQLLKKSIFWLFKIVLVLFLSFATVYFFGTEVKMAGSSMSPTISNKDSVLINRLTNIVFPPNDGDLIAFRPLGNPMANIEIKRIVAVPNDKIKISDGCLYVNGNKAYEEYPLINDMGVLKNETTLGADEYFVLSDNRDIVQDSRNPDIGMVKRSYILGNAWFIIAPRSNRGFIN